MFARPQGLDVEKSLTRLVKMTSSQMYERIKNATNTEIDNLTEQDKNSLDTQLTEFGVYMKKAAPFLKKMKEEMAVYLTSK